MHIEIAAGQQRFTYRREYSRLQTAEVISKNQIEGFARLGFVPVVPEWVVPAAAVGDLFGRQAEQEEILLTGLAAISMVAPSRVPMVSAPFIMNFMLPVPLAS